MLKTVLHKIVNKQNLTDGEMRAVMHTMMRGEATPAQMGGILIGLHMKGETAEELAAAAEVMRSLATPLPIKLDHLVDTCGTGGDQKSLFNVSTAAAFVVAAAGGKVVKHGNRSNSSCSGSADVLEALGVPLTQTPEQVANCLQHCGFGFLFAPLFHQAMKHAVGPRKELGTHTLFNLLGPLCNPASPPHQLIGVFDQKWLQPFVEVLKRLGSKHVLVVHSEDGLDEISLSAPTHLAELKDGKISFATLTPEQFGIRRNDMKTCIVKSAEESKNKLLSALNGESGPAFDLVQLNAGAAIYAADLVPTLQEGIELAEELLKTGKAKATLDAFMAFVKR